MRRRPGAEDGPEHACKTGIPPPSRRLSSMAYSWRRGANNVHDLALNLNPKLNVDLRLDPNMCIQNGPDDLLPLVVRACEIGRAHRMWLSCHAHDDGLRPGESGLSQSGIEAELTSASIVQLRARNYGCVHFKQYCVCVPVCWFRAALSNRFRTVSEHASQGRPSPVETWALACLPHTIALPADADMRGQGRGHRVGGENVDGWRPIPRPAHSSKIMSVQPWGRVRGQGAEFEPPRSPTAEGRCLWIVARPVRSPDGPLGLLRRAMQPWHRNNTV